MTETNTLELARERLAEAERYEHDTRQLSDGTVLELVLYTDLDFTVVRGVRGTCINLKDDEVSDLRDSLGLGDEAMQSIRDWFREIRGSERSEERECQSPEGEGVRS